MLAISGDAWLVFTDACYELDSQDWPCGLGGVLVNPGGQVESFFSITAERVHETVGIRQEEFSRLSC